ncbi:D-alanyl-D-alanine endopeptidase [Nitrincola tapanii]|uniref:D-alanyl-D-alanine endopeptidase n=1 Tax=Nitrincola tapanii TaxID=1708751 RepID=A0A5A9W5Q2_9GAMM|nr:D-alanyl-D-alanine endopeptidase [Nitrincola tapanii]KAA0875418.1 D-alanyl-D-alanine endopeptidase [Nitrincola tapanii]
MKISRHFYVFAAFFLLCFTQTATAIPNRDVNALHLASVHAAVAPLGSQQLWIDKRSDRQVPIASITKLMMALVVVESGLPMQERLKIVPRTETYGKNAYSRIRMGSEVSRIDMLRMALMSSENLASYALAHHYPGGVAAFVNQMNRRAQELGMTQTRFIDPAGLSPGNVSTARDLLKLVAATYQQPLLRQLSTQGQGDVHFRQPNYTLAYTNTNPLVRNERWQVKLSKTGFLSEAGRCLVMVAEVNGQLLAMVMLDSDGLRTPIGDAGRIRRWIETGSSGDLPQGARDYERERLRHYGYR